MGYLWFVRCVKCNMHETVFALVLCVDPCYGSFMRICDLRCGRSFAIYFPLNFDPRLLVDIKRVHLNILS